IQEFYEVTLLDSHRWTETSKGAEPLPPVNLWDFSSLQSTTVTSDTLPSLSTSIEKYRHQDEDSSPQDQSSPQLTEEGAGPELVQVAEKSLSQVESIHGFVSHAHISPMKASLDCILDGSSALGQQHPELPSPTSSTLYPHGDDSPSPSCSSNPYPPIQPAAGARGGDASSSSSSSSSTAAAATSSSMLNSVWYAKKMGRRIMGTLRKTKRLHRRLLTVEQQQSRCSFLPPPTGRPRRIPPSLLTLTRATLRLSPGATLIIHAPGGAAPILALTCATLAEAR
ncbi:hypothetical protein F2P81_000059, partial [Scophthalmus maximus]